MMPMIIVVFTLVMALMTCQMSHGATFELDERAMAKIIKDTEAKNIRNAHLEKMNVALQEYKDAADKLSETQEETIYGLTRMNELQELEKEKLRMELYTAVGVAVVTSYPAIRGLTWVWMVLRGIK